MRGNARGELRTAPEPLARSVRRLPSAAPVPPPPDGKRGRPPRSAAVLDRPHTQAAGACSAALGRVRPAAGGVARGRAHRGRVPPGPRPQRRRPPPAGLPGRRAGADTPGPVLASATHYRDTDCRLYTAPPFCAHNGRNRPSLGARLPPGAGSLSAVGFLRVVMIPMFVPSRMALSLLPPEVLGGQRPFWGRQERSVCLQRRDGRPGLWDKAPHG